MYVKVENNSVVRYPYLPSDLRIDHPNTSFPVIITDEILAEYNIYPVLEADFPDFDDRTQKIIEGIPVKQGEQWVKHWDIVALSEQEQQFLRNKKIQELREARNQALRDSDYVLLPDIICSNKQEWIAYRQQLRDITLLPEFPFNIVWPSKPRNE